MKVIFDANVLISYLLTSEKEGTIAKTVETAFKNEYELILPEEVIIEIQKNITEKKYLAERISESTAARFITSLKSIATIPQPIIYPIPKVGRDRKDDYLLTYAATNEADYLVTGDEDLTVIEEIEGIKIVSPAEFYQILQN